MKNRCKWVTDDQIYIKYHDDEWGVPVHDDKKLFEMLVLEGMQAGLSWLTVLKKRESFRRAFDDYDLDKIIDYDDAKISELLNDEGIIRNRLKLKSVVKNAAAFKNIQSVHGSFDKFIWSYVDHEPIINSFVSHEDVPVNTPLSDKISRDMKSLGFTFVGSTIIYAYMQSVGMVNDHTTDCFLRK